jgi:hypothetical protein
MCWVTFWAIFCKNSSGQPGGQYLYFSIQRTNYAYQVNFRQQHCYASLKNLLFQRRIRCHCDTLTPRAWFELIRLFASVAPIRFKKLKALIAFFSSTHNHNAYYVMTNSTAVYEFLKTMHPGGIWTWDLLFCRRTTIWFVYINYDLVMKL